LKKFLQFTLSVLLAFSCLLTGNTYAFMDTGAARIDVIHSSQDGIVLEMNAPWYRVEQISLPSGRYDSISIPGSDATSRPGEPQLPVLSALIGVPAEAEILLEIQENVQVRIPGNYNLLPVPSPVRPETDLSPGRYTYFADEQAYSLNAFYPKTAVQVEEQGWLRDQRVVRIAFYPFQYNPAEGVLHWNRQVRVEVTFPGDSSLRAGGQVRQDNPFETILQGQLLNYEAAKAWRTLGDAASMRLSSTAAQPSGRTKIVIDHDGLYRLTYADLQSAGLEVDNIDPRNFRMTSQDQEVALYVSGQEDGHFDPGDSITFYGQYFRGNRMAEIYADEDDHWLNTFVYFSDNSLVSWDPQLNATMFEKYTDENVYWLTVAESAAPRMLEVNGTPGGAETPGYFWETVQREEAHEWWSWHFSSEDTWFWQMLRPNTSTPVVTKTYTATLTALATGEYTATIRGEVVARNFNSYSSPDHHTQVFINDQAAAIDDATWDGHIRYAFEGQAPQTSLLEGENLLKLVAQKTANMTADWLYFDWFEIEYARAFEAAGNQLVFSNNQAGTFQYQSHGFANGDIEIYDITTPTLPTRVLSATVTTGGTGTYTVTFEIAHEANARFLVAAVGDSAVIQSPVSISATTPQDFSAIPGAEYVLITHQDFITATQTLANYRASQGLSTLVVDVEELYDQFNYGIYHPIAIKNFLAYGFANWETIPAYAVLIGSGHWNLRGYEGDSKDYTNDPITMPPNLAFVDPWQGEVDSANLLANVVGDAQDILPDLAIGRIPVESAEELDHVIEKIIIFESTTLEDWQQNILFIADNIPDTSGDFVASSENIINSHLSPLYQPLRIYENDYGCTTANSTQCKAVTYAITSTLNITGALFVNYTGHGDVNRWSHEQILRTTDLPGRVDNSYYNHLVTLENAPRFPIVMDLTCLTGYWIYPLEGTTSLVIELLTLENAGAVSTFSPTGLGVANGHDALNAGFYDAFFDGGIRRLGTATLAAKLALFQTGLSFDLIHTYTIFGDPALRIPIIDSIFLPSVSR
jgi:hypothetical protein